MLKKQDKKLPRTKSTGKEVKEVGVIQNVSIQLYRALESACISHLEHSSHFGLDYEGTSVSSLESASK
jgi:hypothetical protein